MLNLALKDLMLQKKLIIFALGYAVFLFFAFIPPIINEMVYSLGAIAISYISFMGIISSEDKNNSDIILNSLPIKRAQVVISKYVSLVVITVIGLVIMGLFGAIFKLIGFPPVQRYFNISDLVRTVVVVGLLSSLYYPLYLKFGPKYMRIFNAFFFVLIFSMPGIIAKIMAENQSMDFLATSINSILVAPGWFILASLIITSIAILASMVVSIRIYKNKEF